MKTYKDVESNLVAFAEEDDLNLKLDKTMVKIDELPKSFYDQSCFFQVTAPITVGNITIPQFTRGIFINNGGSNDLVMIAVDSAEYIYIGYRNNGEWRQIRRI